MVQLAEVPVVCGGSVEIDAKTLYLYFVIFCLFQNNST